MSQPIHDAEFEFSRLKKEYIQKQQSLISLLQQLSANAVRYRLKEGAEFWQWINHELEIELDEEMKSSEDFQRAVTKVMVNRHLTREEAAAFLRSDRREASFVSFFLLKKLKITQILSNFHIF